MNLPSGQRRELRVAVRFSDIRSPGSKYVFVEEDVSTKRQRWNAGGFVLMANNNYWEWWDWPANYHKDASTLGFADGHAERRRWEDSRTIQIIKQGRLSDNPQGGISPLQPDNPDVQWMNQGYMPMF